MIEDVFMDDVSSFEKFKMKNGSVMGHIHVQADGTTIPIYQMDDSHLMNTIGLFSRKVAKAATAHAKKTTLLDVVMEQKAPTQKAMERLRDLISDGYPLIGRYLAEAGRRGMLDQANEAAKPFFETITSLAGVSPEGGKVELYYDSDELNAEFTDN